jgi:hypothetical protein
MGQVVLLRHGGQEQLPPAAESGQQRGAHRAAAHQLRARQLQGVGRPRAPVLRPQEQNPRWGCAGYLKLSKSRVFHAALTLFHALFIPYSTSHKSSS